MPLVQWVGRNRRTFVSVASRRTGYSDQKPMRGVKHGSVAETGLKLFAGSRGEIKCAERVRNVGFVAGRGIVR